MGRWGDGRGTGFQGGTSVRRDREMGRWEKGRRPYMATGADGAKENGHSRSRKPIRSHRDLDIYINAFDMAMEIFWITRKFPKEEIFSLTSQIVRSSRSVSVNISEAWRKRRYEAAFVSKLSDAETEAAETQVHLEFAVKCGYLDRNAAARLYKAYDQLISGIVNMIVHADAWVIKPKGKR